MKAGPMDSRAPRFAASPNAGGLSLLTLAEESSRATRPLTIVALLVTLGVAGTAEANPFAAALRAHRQAKLARMAERIRVRVGDIESYVKVRFPNGTPASMEQPFRSAHQLDRYWHVKAIGDVADAINDALSYSRRYGLDAEPAVRDGARRLAELLRTRRVWLPVISTPGGDPPGPVLCSWLAANRRLPSLRTSLEKVALGLY